MNNEIVLKGIIAYMRLILLLIMNKMHSYRYSESMACFTEA
jgi:hypothetical protein